MANNIDVTRAKEAKTKNKNGGGETTNFLNCRK